jgi:hypothetical protein
MADTAAGAKLYIGTTTGATVQSEFEGDSYTEIKEISNIGQFGAAANVLTFPVLGDDYVLKAKGTRNAGDPAVVVGRNPTDPGQLALRAAEATNNYYNFKLDLADSQSPTMTNTVVYFRALVTGKPTDVGGVEDFITDTFTLAIYPAPIYVEGSVTSV